MNLYEILGVGNSSSREEIKRAYVLMLRTYPAESQPEKFQMVQNAYQILIDQDKRKKYDIETVHGEEMDRLHTQAIEYFESERYELANRTYAKLLEYLPEDTGYLNRYAMTYARMNQQQLAIDFYKKAIELEADLPAFHYNLAVSYEKSEDYSRAIRSYKQALMCDPINFDVVEALSALYIDLEDYENAWFIVETSMKKKGLPLELKPLYIQRLVEVAVIIKGHFEMKIALKHAEIFFAEQVDYKEDIIVNLYNLSLKLANLNNYRWALPIIDFVNKYNSYDTQTKNLHRRIHKDAKVYLEFDELYEDEAILKELRYKIYLYLYSNEYNVTEFAEKVEYANDVVYEACIKAPSSVRTSIRTIKMYYPNIASEMDEWLKRLQSCI